MPAHQPLEDAFDDLLDQRVAMHRPDHHQAGLRLQQPPHAACDRFDAMAPVLAAMGRDQHDPLMPDRRRQGREAGRQHGRRSVRERLQVIHAPMGGIDDGIAGGMDGHGRDAFAAQVGRGDAGRREVPSRQSADELAVGLLRKRILDVEGAQAGLDVPDRHPQIETGQRADQRARGVSLHQHGGRPHPGQRAMQLLDQHRRQMRQGVGLALQWQHVIGSHAEELVERPGHLVVLARVEHQRGHPGSPQRSMDRCHLDDLRARAHAKDH